MKKDLVITTISDNYVWTDIKNWFYSLKSTGFDGDILVIGYNFQNTEHEFLQQLSDAGAQIILPKNTYRGEEENAFEWHSGRVTPENANKLIHNVRLFHVWQYFTETNAADRYNRVIFTDGRDIVFQTNPTIWLNQHLREDILVPSEYVTYANEPWNQNNALQNYGPYVYHYILKDKPACNVGSFAVTAEICADFCLIMYLMSNNIGHADQPAFNILTSTLLKDRTQTVDYNDSWALQIGAIINNVHDIADFKNGIVTNKETGLAYCLVHQYDRVPEYKEHFDSKL
jgi:hypothetical protein